REGEDLVRSPAAGGNESARQLRQEFSARRTGMKMSDLLRAVPGASTVKGPADREIARVCQDSRTASAGALFVAVKGSRADGAQFVKDAIDKGAVAVVSEDDLELPAEVSLVRVPDARRAIALLAAKF